MMRLTWARDLAEGTALREQWNALVFQMEKPQVFYTWEWAAALTRTYGSSIEPWIATAYEGDELVGVAALARTSQRERETVFLSGNTADYCDFISLPAKRKELVGEVLRALHEDGTRRLVLANLPADSASVGALKQSSPYKVFLRTGYVCAQVQLGEGEERRALVQALLKKKMFRRSINTLERIGPVTLHHGSAGPGRRSVDKFCETHVARFLSTGRVSNLVNAERREFLVELARLMSERDWFDLMTLRAGKWVLALNYGFRFRGSWFWYQPTIVNKFEDLSPGYCLLAKIVEDASHDPEAQVVDLGLGAEDYKERFANAERTTLHATLSESGIDLWRARGRYWGAQTINKTPAVEHWARGLQTRVHRVRKQVEKQGLGGATAWAATRFRRSITATDEVVLFEWPEPAQSDVSDEQLVPISWEILSSAAMRYSEDSETMEYLLRSAARFRSGGRGFALTGADGVAQHFAWVSPYEGFAMAEVNHVLHAPTPESVMIFDCWTPHELRRRGLYSGAIGRLAQLLALEGKDVWIFGAAANRASRAGIEKAGFQRRASLFRRKLLGWTQVRQERWAATQTDTVEVLQDSALG